MSRAMSPDQNVSILFVNNAYIGNIRTVWHRKLYIKTYLIFWAQNVLITPYGMLLASAKPFALHANEKSLV